MQELSGKTAVVTGGGRGIGRGIAEAFAACGARVVIVGRRASTEARPDWSTIDADLTVAEGCRAVAEHESIAGGVDVLVNNAGLARFLPLAETDEDALAAHVDINLLAPFRLSRALLEGLRARRGNIINISSYFARRMLANRPSAAYSMTKGGLDALTRSLAFELGPEGIRVNAIAPGTVDTPLFRENLAALSDDARASFERGIPALYPIGRLGQPADIASVATFLASEQAAWMTGTVVSVDGGLTTH